MQLSLNRHTVEKHYNLWGRLYNTKNKSIIKPLLFREYEKLLKEAYGKLPDIQSERSRFEIPKVRGHMQGNKTIISNF